MTDSVNVQAAFEPGRRLILWSPEGEPLVAPVQKQLNSLYAVEVAGEVPQISADEVVVVLCRSPAESLCQLLLRGQEPGQALREWQVQARSVLTLKRKKRRQVHIFDVRQVSQAPETFGGYFGLSGQAVELGRSAELGELDPVLLALASERFRADRELGALAGEFVASTVPLAKGIQTDIALDAYLEKQEVLLELRLLQDQQRSMYEQVETLYSERLAVERQLEEAERQAEQRLQQMRNGLDSYQEQVDALRAERDKLRGDFAHAQAQLQEAVGKISELESTAEIRACEVRDLQEQIRRFETSKSFRITAPLRRLRQIMSLKRYA